jgi:polysaccharide chain length determinant protein (PEP-CTERM system associated)
MSDSRDRFHLAAALRRRLAAIAVATGAGALIGYWVAMALPNYYQSSATIFVATQEINRRLAGVGAAPFDLGARLDSMTARVLSRERLSELIDEVQLYPQPGESDALPDALASEQVIARLRARVRAVSVESGIAAGDFTDRVRPDSFRVSFVHRDPRLAADVAGRLAEAFVEEYIDERMALSRMRLDAIEGEFARHSERHRTAEAEVAAFRAANAGRLPEERATNQRLLDRALDELRQAQRARDRARSSVASWEVEVLAASAPSTPSESLDPVRRLQQLDLQVAEFRARGFTDRHPALIRAEREMLALRRQIEAEGGTPEGRSFTRGGPLNAEAQRSLAAQQLDRSTAEATRLEARVELLEQRLATSAEVAESLSALNEASKQIVSTLANLGDRRHLAKLQVDVERRQLSEEFRLVESALPAAEPSSPDRLRILLVGVLAGLLCGVAVAWVAELRDESFRSARDVRRAFQHPVLAVIPDVVVKADRVARRRRGLRNAVATLLLAVVGLAGGAVAYLYVNGTPDWLQATIEARTRDARSSQARPNPTAVPARAPASVDPAQEAPWPKSTKR